jgi:prepilin-type N-terminal cleavage/methylation domain-containing protein
MVRNRRQANRAGFTLVELLVVITIIGILASLITMAVFAALRRARETEIQQECSKIYAGFESFKEKFTAFPPDGNGGQQKVTRFVQKAFPRARGKTSPPGDVTNPTTGPANSIVFWLSKVSTDPTQPFRQGAGGFGGANQSDEFFKFYQFADSRIRENQYFPPNYDPERDPPFLYFQYDTYGNANFRSKDGMTFKPYDRGQSQNQQGGKGGNNKDYFAPESCQIIAAGLDKVLGTGGTVLTEAAASSGGGQFIAEEDEDNLVSFATQKVGDISN